MNNVITCEIVEFAAWSALVMAPIIWWLQGPSVSTDQFVIRTSLIAISAVVAVGMRIRALVTTLKKAPGTLEEPAKNE